MKEKSAFKITEEEHRIHFRPYGRLFNFGYKQHGLGEKQNERNENTKKSSSP